MRLLWLLVFAIPLFFSCNSLGAQPLSEKEAEELLDDFFELNFESCFRYKYHSIDDITEVKTAGNALVVRGIVINGGNWGPVKREFKATIEPVKGKNQLLIKVDKQAGLVEIRWVSCSKYYDY